MANKTPERTAGRWCAVRPISAIDMMGFLRGEATKTPGTRAGHDGLDASSTSTRIRLISCCSGRRRRESGTSAGHRPSHVPSMYQARGDGRRSGEFSFVFAGARQPRRGQHVPPRDLAFRASPRPPAHPGSRGRARGAKGLAFRASPRTHDAMLTASAAGAWHCPRDNPYRALAPCAGRGSPQLGALTRSMYLFSRVSTRIHSPSLMNSGTPMLAPVDTLAGLVTFVAVSPRAPGSVSRT